MSRYLSLVTLLFPMAMSDLCSEPRISKGQVSGRAGPNYFSGSVRCEEGLVLVGNPAIRCSAGVWSGAMPVCAAPGSCSVLPLVVNGRTIPIRGAMGAAVRFTCFKGYRLIGEKMGYCMGTTWSMDEMPVCINEHSKQLGDEPSDDASKHSIVDDEQKESKHLSSYKVTLERKNDVEAAGIEMTTEETIFTELSFHTEIEKNTQNIKENSIMNNEQKESNVLTKFKANREINIDKSDSVEDLDEAIIEVIDKAQPTEKKSTTEEPVQAVYEPEAEIAKMKDNSSPRKTSVNVRQAFISSSAYSSTHASLAITFILAVSRILML